MATQHSYHGTVYVLKLQDNKYYVGHTKEKDMKRIMEHGNTSSSAQWTKKHKPIELIGLFPGSTLDEDMVTLHAMEVYGWQNVRGGKWCRTDIHCPPKELNTKYLLNPKFCTKCERDGHTDNICLYNIDVDGDAIFR
ncbi:hypothetical protein [Dishui Lake large algae virus 1]|nr:hypothetical protein [Dishui Lake large algae virus 1]